jgi:hypothetical protein
MIQKYILDNPAIVKKSQEYIKTHPEEYINQLVAKPVQNPKLLVEYIRKHLKHLFPEKVKQDSVDDRSTN